MQYIAHQWINLVHISPTARYLWTKQVSKCWRLWKVDIIKPCYRCLIMANDDDNINLQIWINYPLTIFVENVETHILLFCFGYRLQYLMIYTQFEKFHPAKIKGWWLSEKEDYLHLILDCVRYIFTCRKRRVLFALDIYFRINQTGLDWCSYYPN